MGLRPSRWNSRSERDMVVRTLKRMIRWCARYHQAELCDLGYLDFGGEG